MAELSLGAMAEVPLFLGTGGIPDILGYLRERLNLHVRIEAMQHSISAQAVFDALDSATSADFLEYLSEGVVFRFGSQPAQHGKRSIHETLSQFYLQFKSMRHTIHAEWRMDSHLIVKGEAQYQRHNDTLVSVPFCNVWRINSAKLIEEYDVYCDSSALMLPESPSATAYGQDG